MAGWVALAAGITAYDLARWRRGESTLSEDFGRWCRHPIGRWACYAGWATLTTHLFIGRPKWWRLPERKVS